MLEPSIIRGSVYSAKDSARTHTESQLATGLGSGVRHSKQLSVELESKIRRTEMQNLTNVENNVDACEAPAQTQLRHVSRVLSNLPLRVRVKAKSSRGTKHLRLPAPRHSSAVPCLIGSDEKKSMSTASYCVFDLDLQIIA